MEGAELGDKTYDGSHAQTPVKASLFWNRR
jgi:hypothetical protein